MKAHTVVRIDIKDILIGLHSLRAQIASVASRVDAMITAMREACPHPNQTSQSNMNSETEHNCPDCGASW